MFLRQLILSVAGKVFKIYSKIHLESPNFQKSMYRNWMLKLYFYYLQFLKIQSCEKSVKYKSSGEYPKLTNYVIFFLAILRLCQDFLRKLPKLIIIRNACIVYLLTFATRFSTFLKYLFW